MVFLTGFDRRGLSWEGERPPFEFLDVFADSCRRGICFGEGALAAVLKVCAASMEVWLGLEIHAWVFKKGLDSNTHLRSALMDFYEDCLGSEHAEALFDEMTVRDPFLFKKAIALSTRSGTWYKNLILLREMHSSGFKADNITIARVLQACGRLEALREGAQIHGYAMRSGAAFDLLVCNSLISMYSKNSVVEKAGKVFELMRDRSSASWNSLLSGYTLNGFLDEAWKLFDRMSLSDMKPDLVTWNCLISGEFLHGSMNGALMVLRMMQSEGFKPNSSSMTRVLQTISDSGSLEFGKEVHGYVMRNGHADDIYIGTSLVDMYLKCGSLSSARKVFDGIEGRNTFTWNCLIKGYAYNGLFDEALELLMQMEKEGIKPDLTTWNGVISGYSMKGLFKQALVLIRRLRSMGLTPNVVSWTAIISGCCQSGNNEESLLLLREMQKEHVEPNAATIASLLRACAGLAFLGKGQELHCLAIQKGLDEDIFVSTALIDMYSKSGSLRNARHVFEKASSKSLVSWNAMLVSLSTHGLGEEAISLFHEMCDSGIRPDGITFTALLSACRHSGLITEGWKYFDAMKSDYNVNPTMEHYACMVDLLGRGGYLDEAWEFIKDMPLEPDAGVWGALLRACKAHRNLELAETAARKLFMLEPLNSGNYLLMMDLYALENRWEDVENLRYTMNVVGVTDRYGWSWIQINQKVHVFYVNEESFLDMGEIYFELFQLVSEARKLGYVPDVCCVVQNVEGEEKEKILLSHTEKLAVAYGLIHADRSVPIRVIKNARICSDCHTLMKYISRIRDRKISLRDGRRFHHFEDGKCSCNDYW
ncbi:Pentatricopeptide repeat-containing protein [Acorus calamus]|uniref:Pentatricopeptide repeat-containing protein n=1 Tax=Acorus calamus TaxID=4465 RepID=A0AAV9CBT5_ACOCL|nr:Pentatricopeptide repeat-containing protein [Acorus calamus]